MSHMFGLFKRRRVNGAVTRDGMAPPLSAELRAAHDREFAEQLQRRLAEKNGTVGKGEAGKVEPIFKSTTVPKAGPSPTRPTRVEPDGAKRDAKPAAAPPDARRSSGIRLEGRDEPAPAVKPV